MLQCTCMPRDRTLQAQLDDVPDWLKIAGLALLGPFLVTPLHTWSLIGDSTFIGAVVKHIHTLLQEREGVYKQDWVVGEAMSASKLQNGGTFLNTLARKLDDIVIPLLSEILGFIDRSYTLDLIDPQDQDSPLSQFWLKMFSNPQICQFRYNDIVTRSAEEVPGMGSRISTQDFKAKMPFSWLIKATVDGTWDTAKTTAGNSQL